MNYHKHLEHAERLRAKRERLEGLEALYGTYEQEGVRPYESVAMRCLKKRILSTRQQLRTMGEGIGPDEAGRSS
jgi:hypothetical protein